MFDTSHLLPLLVHFPIALVVFGFLADVTSLIYKKEVCLSKTVFYLLIIGTLAAIATWLSGILYTARQALNSKTESTLPFNYAICPVFGNTYNKANIDPKCTFCQTPG